MIISFREEGLIRMGYEDVNVRKGKFSISWDGCGIRDLEGDGGGCRKGVELGRRGCLGNEGKGDLIEVMIFFGDS